MPEEQNPHHDDLASQARFIANTLGCSPNLIGAVAILIAIALGLAYCTQNRYSPPAEYRIPVTPPYVPPPSDYVHPS